MPILNTTPTDPATIAANQVRALIRQQYQQLLQSGMQGYRLIWNNPQATPASILAELGTDAYSAFALAQLNINTLQSTAALCGVTPPVVPSVPAKYVLSFNPDGSAVLSDAPSSSSSSSSSST